MLRTLVWFLYFWLYLVVALPRLLHAKKLDRQGLIAERDAYVERMTKRWACAMTRAAGGKVEVSGNEHVPADAPVVFIANHQGNYDIPIMIGHVVGRKALISKIEVLKIPILRSWMKLMQCEFMDRKNLRQSARIIQQAVESLRGGTSMVIFPEGTRSKSDKLGDFKHGSFKLALKAEVPIVPVTIDGSWRLFERTGFMTPGTIRVVVHPPVPTAGLTKEEQDALPDRIRGIIAAGLPNGGVG